MFACPVKYVDASPADLDIDLGTRLGTNVFVPVVVVGVINSFGIAPLLTRISETYPMNLLASVGWQPNLK